MEGDLEVKNEEAYALVTVTFRGVRYVLLIEREDGAGWAMPGGAIEPGEWSKLTAARKLREETALVLSSIWRSWKLNEPRDGIVVARCDLGDLDALPEVRDAMWCPIGGPIENIFSAHREILGALR